ncbi:hypothetical protein AB0A69_27505 [Streptomyces sp. NPDC045431]|uniref:hypothetical protein n=1 Tax=Streptomyces sp. NPDC045431 TaxID=3155613 RepID=UPI00340B7B42
MPALTPGEDDSGELLAGAGYEAAAGGGGSVVDNVDTGRAPLVQNGLEGGYGRGALRVVLLPEGLPVAGEVPQGVVGPVDRDHQPWHPVEVAVEAGTAFQLGAEDDQGVVDAGDVAAVRDRRQVLGPQAGDAGVVEDQDVGALVEELGGEGAQDGRAAGAGAGADQDVRSGVDVDGDGPAVGADAMSAAESGSAWRCSRRSGSVRRSSFGSAVVFVIVMVFLFCAVPGERCSPGL